MLHATARSIRFSNLFYQPPPPPAIILPSQTEVLREMPGHKGFTQAPTSPGSNLLAATLKGLFSAPGNSRYGTHWQDNRDELHLAKQAKRTVLKDGGTPSDNLYEEIEGRTGKIDLFERVATQELKAIKEGDREEHASLLGKLKVFNQMRGDTPVSTEDARDQLKRAQQEQKQWEEHNRLKNSRFSLERLFHQG